MTQILARTTTLLDGRKTVKMTGRVYLRAIVPIGFFFSLSLICGNKTYLYLSVLVQSLLSSAEYKMDPLVSLYYFAPVCAIMNSVASIIFELPSLTMQDIYNVGVFVLILNAFVAFMLNVSVVFLVSLPRPFLRPYLPPHLRTNNWLRHSRSAKHPPSSSPCVASSKTSSSSPPQ